MKGSGTQLGALHQESSLYLLRYGLIEILFLFIQRINDLAHLRLLFLRLFPFIDVHRPQSLVSHIVLHCIAFVSSAQSISLSRFIFLEDKATKFCTVSPRIF
jgi:hypothetical protein